MNARTDYEKQTGDLIRCADLCEKHDKGLVELLLWQDSHIDTLEQRWMSVAGQDKSIAIPYCVVRNRERNLLGFGSYVAVGLPGLSWVTETAFRDEVCEYFMLPPDSYEAPESR